jgi:tyrosinase
VTNINTLWIDGEQNNDSVAKALRDEKPPGGQGVLSESLRDAFSRLMSIDSFTYFATTRAFKVDIAAGIPVDTRFDSSEQLHNFIHNAVGGPLDEVGDVGVRGHMAHVPLSAFDPIFWLHHA